MIKREKYLKQIRDFYDSDLIKIITGVRRCGKSVILEEIRDEIKAKSDNCIYLDFDDRSVTSSIETWNDIVNYVNSHRKDDLCYVFLDEIQEIHDWQFALKSLRRENCSLFVTGSNSKLLSGEFTKELSGRYVSFRIRPFVYKEIKEYALELNKEISISDYLIWGGFPKITELNNADGIKRYLNDLDETIVLNDIVNRYKIRKTNEFKKFVNFILINNSRQYSAKSISNTMKSNGIACSSNTVQKWIGYLKEAYIIDELQKYSTKAKKELEQSNKLYNCDVGLNSIRQANSRYDISHNIENIVYNELIYMGYSLTVYNNNGKEVDFLANKDHKNYYVQVATTLSDDKAYEREFKAFKGLSQTDKKIIITNDEIDYSTSNVEHLSLSKFLSVESLDQT